VIRPTPWLKMKNRTDRLRKFVAINSPAPRWVILAEIGLIEKARDEWRDQDREMTVVLRAVLDRLRWGGLHGEAFRQIVARAEKVLKKVEGGET
jgi:hypothetical protein